jgi:GTP cyclohydrolase I
MSDLTPPMPPQGLQSSASAQANPTEAAGEMASEQSVPPAAASTAPAAPAIPGAPAPARPLEDATVLAGWYSRLLTGLGEDVEREGLRNTPLRAVKAMQYLTRGYHLDLDAIVNNALFESENDEMVLLKNIELYSLCEHHVLPIIGKAHVAYLPKGRVLGLSKIARIVDMYAARLQIQENLTRQIAEAILKVTHARGVGVVIEAKHMCMTMRGIEKQNSSMSTSVMLGTFRDDPRTREEFLDLIRHG